MLVCVCDHTVQQFFKETKGVKTALGSDHLLAVIEYMTNAQTLITKNGA